MKQLKESRFSVSEFESNTWRVTVEEGVTREDILHPAYFAHCARRITPFDRMEILDDLSSFYAEALVLSVNRNGVRLQILHWHELDATEPVDTDECEVKWTGPHGKFAVVRTADKATLVNQISTKIEAQRWLAENTRKIA